MRGLSRVVGEEGRRIQVKGGAIALPVCAKKNLFIF